MLFPELADVVDACFDVQATVDDTLQEVGLVAHLAEFAG